MISHAGGLNARPLASPLGFAGLSAPMRAVPVLQLSLRRLPGLRSASRWENRHLRDPELLGAFPKSDFFTDIDMTLQSLS